MSGAWEQIPESCIRDLEGKRRRYVEAQKENDFNLDALVGFLYPDAAHLVFELLQNAEDAEATSARFELSDTKLSFTHNGRPFSYEDIDSITGYFKSAKHKLEDKIGRFGIGFKSVFGCTKTPRIYSDTVAFEIVDRIVPRPIPRPDSLIRNSSRQTVIELPFNRPRQTIDEVREEIWLGLEGMSVMSVLHLESITSIEWRMDADDSGSLIRTEIGDGVVQVRAIRSTGEERRYFLRFREPYAERSSMHLDVVFELEEKDGAQEALQVEDEALADRFRIVPAERGSVAVFFPAAKETSNLRFHLHAPFIPELSRASIKEHADNHALFARLAKLVAKSLSTIRDLGLLDREFLGVLPNSQDSLSEAYEPFHKAVIRAMSKEPLVPMQGGGHGQAPRLLQGRANLKSFLGADDIHFLMSGWDAPYPRGPRTNRCTGPPSNYQGWAVSATQRHTAVDRFLGDLKIDEFEVKYVVPPSSKEYREIKEWLATHDAPWHRSYYESVEKSWDASRGAYDRLRELPIVRTQSGEYRRASVCRFANDGDDAPEGVAIADPDTYSDGKGAKRGLERLGVREIDDESKAMGILETYYSESGHRPTWDEHRNHVETFIGLVQEQPVTANTFGEYILLLDRNKDWCRPGRLYAGKEYPAASAAPYYRHLERRADYPLRAAQALRYELHRDYRDIPGFSEFARRIGVCYRIPITKTGCHKNPNWSHLWGDRGYVTAYEIDHDWQIRHLDRMLQQLNEAKRCAVEREDLARTIHAALDQTRECTWPPPKHIWCDKAVSGSLVAVYRRNRSAGFRTAPSQLVFTLRKYAWVPQEHEMDGVTFVRPREARPGRLPQGFAFDSGWAWVKAIEFGEEYREADRKITQAKLDQEAKASEREAMAKDLGFKNLEVAEEAQWFAELPKGERNEIREQYAVRRRPPPEFERPRNPNRRRKRAKEQAEVAPNRRTEPRKRNVVEGEASLKEEARTKLRANYEEHAHVSLCQVIGCQDRSFKYKSEEWYFEAVRFLGLDKMVAADYLALCPRHAAMFQHANESKSGLKEEFQARCASGKGLDALAIPVALAGENVEVLLAPKHVIDLRAAWEVDVQKDSGGK
ncbi:sacsin N-terminal ATP-binding-like domain-containing protein [Candidatus Spongiisocius sp.]|uniref:sacsin N-terminal ATP-binding-like domain-containing protein n=1 Tax=Candidatus Spongiisocius sp. TaxID=3101273 RepID=UPI003B5A2B24